MRWDRLLPENRRWLVDPRGWTNGGRWELRAFPGDDWLSRWILFLTIDGWKLCRLLKPSFFGAGTNCWFLQGVRQIITHKLSLFVDQTQFLDSNDNKSKISPKTLHCFTDILRNMNRDMPDVWPALTMMFKDAPQLIHWGPHGLPGNAGKYPFAMLGTEAGNNKSCWKPPSE